MLSPDQLLATPWTVAGQAPLSTGFFRQEYSNGLPFPPQGIFLTQRLNWCLHLLHCQWILYHLRHLRSPPTHLAHIQYSISQYSSYSLCLESHSTIRHYSLPTFHFFFSLSMSYESWFSKKIPTTSWSHHGSWVISEYSSSELFLPGSRFYSPVISAGSSWCCLVTLLPVWWGTQCPKEPKGQSFLPVTGSPLLPAPAWDKCHHCYWLGFISVLGDRQGQCSCCHVPVNHFISCSGSSCSELLTLPGTEPLGITLSHILGEKAVATHSSTLAWTIPWTEEPGGLWSMGSLWVGHNWAISLSLFTFIHWRRKWQPTPVFLPGESQGQGSLVGCHLWGLTESDTTEAS